MDLQQVNKAILSFSITIEDAKKHRRYNALVKRHQKLGSAQPVACLQVPNKLLLLWSKKQAFCNRTCEGCNIGFQHYALANDSLKSSETALKVGVKSLDHRLNHEMSRITLLFKKHKKGKPFEKLNNGSTHVWLYESEIIRLPQHTSSSTAAVLQLHGKDTSYCIQ